MSPLLVVFLVVLASLAWAGKQILGSLIGQQVRGSIPELVTRSATAAAKLLPPELASDYLEDWLAELASLELKPLSSVRFANGLPRAARGIAALAGLPVPATRRELLATRLFDIAASAAVLAFIAPLLLLIALWVKLSSPGPVLDRHVRIGRHGAFCMYRFRTARRESGSRACDRVLLLSEMDHLPALLNVLRGELAIIGPPAHPTRDGRASAINRTAKLSVVPGIVSWQLLAGTGAVRMTMDEATLRDAERGFWNDLRLIVLAGRAVLTRETRTP